MGRTILLAILGILTLASFGRAGDRYALLVGVKNYDRAELTSLDYTENDVEGLATVLKQGRYKRVVLMTQSSAASNPRLRPTSANIRREMGELLGACTRDDIVVLAFAGHGLQFAGSNEPYFCPSDASIKDKSTLISLTETYDAMARCKAKIKVLFSDSCRNDPLSKKDRAELAKKVSAPRVTSGREKAPENVVAMFSCSEGEVAFESAALKHGIFFHYIIKGLSGEAATGIREVTLNGLTDYVQVEVPRHVKAVVSQSARQRPENAGRTNARIVLVEIADLEARTRVLLMRGRFGDAEEMATRALKEMDRDRDKPKQAKLLAMRAHAREQLKKPKEALEDVELALNRDASLQQAYITRGKLFLQANKVREAITDFDTALGEGGRHPTALLNRGKAYLKTGELTRAMADLTAAIQADPKNPEAYLHRAKLKFRKKDNEGSLADLNLAVTLAPKWGEVYYERARVRLVQDDPEEAMRDLDEAIKYDPRRAEAWNQRGLLHQKNNDLPKAVDDFTRAIKLRPNYAAALFNRALVFASRKDYETALADLDASLHAAPGLALVWFTRGVAHARMKNYEKAVHDFTEVIRREPKMAAAYAQRALAYKALKDFRRQKEDEDRARALTRK